MYDRNLRLYFGPGSEYWRYYMSTLDPPFPELANRTHISSSWAEFENMTKYDVLEKVSDHVYSLDVLFIAHVT